MTRELSRRSIWLLACLLVTGQFAFAQQTGPEYGWSSLAPPPPPSTTRAWERSPIESFSWPTSVKPGAAITFYTSVIDTANHPSYRIQIFRMGDSTPRVDLGPFQSHFYPLRAQNGAYIYPTDINPPKPIDFKSGCSQWWASSAQAYSIPTTGWPSGLYYANMVFNPATTDTGTAYFVIRAANPGTSSKILYKFPANTYQAYNWWGGGSLYSCTQDVASLTVTDSIAMDRPLKFEFAKTLKLYSVDRYFIRWAETSGYTMEYCDNTDVDKNEANFLSNYKFIIHVGHDEYWSGASEFTAGERANEENFKNASGNLAFFAANTCYWRIYWVPNAGGVIDYKRLKCKKDKCNGADYPPPDLWRAGNNSNPEAFFIGSQYEKGYNDGQDIPAQVYNKDHWIFKGTNLQNGQLFGLGNDPSHTKGILGPEIDNTNYSEKPQFAFLNTLEILAERLVPTVVQEVPVKVTADITHQTTYYEDTQSNARVFNAATIQWARGLAEYYDTNDWNRMKQINSNILDHFSFKKYLGNIYTSLSWGNSESAIELDGDTFIQPGKTLTLTNNFTLTINPGVTLYVDGTLVIGKNVTITGGGQIVTRGSGAIKVTNSATALASNNSRKLARGVNGNYHLVFENDGEICYERMTNTGAVTEFRRLSNGVADGVKSNPSIYVRDNNILVVWQKNTGSSHDVTFHKSTDYGVTWPTSNRKVIASAVGSNPPLPVISSPATSLLMVVYRTTTNLSYRTSADNGNNWFAAAAVPSSGAAGNSPALAVTTSNAGYPRSALVNAATGGNGAVFYRYFIHEQDSTGWTSLLKNLSLAVPGSYTGHKNPSLAPSGDVNSKVLHVAWEATLSTSPVIIHRQATNWVTWPPNSYSILTYYQGLTLPSITGLASLPSETAELLFQNASQSSIFKMHYTNAYWNSVLYLANGFNPSASIGNTNAKYVWTSGSAAPYQIQISTETLSKINASSLTTVYHRSIAIIDTTTSNWLEVRLDKLAIKTKSGEELAIPFATAKEDDNTLKPAKAFDNLASSSITLPADAESLFVSCQVNGQGLSTIKNNADAINVELKLIAKKAGALKLPIINTTIDGLPETVRTVALGIANLAGDEANLLISVSGISNKSSLIASLGHIYEVVETPVGKILSPIAENTAPKDYALSTYPNPFNPSTQVYFAMKESGPATVRIYNLSGQLVRELLNDYREAGEHTLPWDGRDHRGAVTASGVYFIRFATGSTVKVNKVMLVR